MNSRSRYENKRNQKRTSAFKRIDRYKNIMIDDEQIERERDR